MAIEHKSEYIVECDFVGCESTVTTEFLFEIETRWHWRVDKQESVYPNGSPTEWWKVYCPEHNNLQEDT